MCKYGRFLCPLMLTFAFLLSGCTSSHHNSPADDGKELTNTSDFRQGSTDSKAIDQLLHTLNNFTGLETDNLETQFFWYYHEHNYELLTMPVFEKHHSPDWNELTQFILWNNDNQMAVDGIQSLTDETVSQITARFFGELEYPDQSSAYLTFSDGIYTAVPADMTKNGYFRLTRVTEKDGEYTAVFDGFYFSDLDFTDEYETASHNQKAVRDQAETKGCLQPGAFCSAIQNIFMNPDYASILDVDETVTVTFSLSGNPDYPFIYTSCERVKWHDISEP